LEYSEVACDRSRIGHYDVDLLADDEGLYGMGGHTLVDLYAWLYHRHERGESLLDPIDRQLRAVRRSWDSVVAGYAEWLVRIARPKS
jgi:hypothetical protein